MLWGFLYVLKIVPVTGGAYVHPHGRSHIVFLHCTEVFLNLWGSTLNNQTRKFKKHFQNNTKGVKQCKNNLWNSFDMKILKDILYISNNF